MFEESLQELFFLFVFVFLAVFTEWFTLPIEFMPGMSGILTVKVEKEKEKEIQTEEKIEPKWKQDLKRKEEEAKNKTVPNTKSFLEKKIQESIDKSEIISFKERINSFQSKINYVEKEKYIEPIFKKEIVKEDAILEKLLKLEENFHSRMKKIEEDYIKIFKKVAPTTGSTFDFKTLRFETVVRHFNENCFKYFGLEKMSCGP
jgi:hypothetical protein